MITVAEFAELRNEKPDTVSAYIRRNAKDFEGHLGKEKNRMTLDEEAVEKLNKVYPLPKPIEVIEDTESRKALIIMQQKYIELQNEMQTLKDEVAESRIALADSRAQVLLLEQKSADLDEAKAKVEELHTENAENAVRIATLETEATARMKELENVETELKRLKNRGFWARVFNR